jgi:O-antigen chain-terminating methyltransferase
MRAREVLTDAINGQANSLQKVANALRMFVGSPDRGSVDKLYADFEDTFRGNQQLVKERQQVYLPRLMEVQVGSASAPVIDLGCGRGEWLELLADHHLVASGVDSNPGMIDRCRALGINATLGDAFTHLRGLADQSMGAVTSFHMVEHMPFDNVIALLDEAWRVLRPGGVLILETPNPQNVLVGSNTFWIDPTHLKPIPSQTLLFFVKARGFQEAEIWNLQPNVETIHLQEDPAGLGARLNDYLYGPQDYGIIARRP